VHDVRNECNHLQSAPQMRAVFSAGSATGTGPRATIGDTGAAAAERDMQMTVKLTMAFEYMTDDLV